MLSQWLGRYLQSLIAGAWTALAATAGFALIVTAAACAIWSATRHIARLDIMGVLRAENAD